MLPKSINRSGKNKIIKNLKQFGIDNLPYILTKKHNEVFAFSGSLNEKKLKKLEPLNIRQIGAKILSREGSKYRLTLDSLTILKPTKKIIEISDKKAKRWLEGKEINIGKDIQGFVILKNKGELIGCGKVTNQKVTNFIPKGRRIN